MPRILDDGVKLSRITAIDAELKHLEETYLPPRTLSDLSMTPVPEAALERKARFEERAEPLRVERRALLEELKGLTGA